mmetsp:Transcript_23974/g.42471  ORF Transcript_23974/g.42471 Transcript_23974/m.42471 type:complete len:207 (+) Transcript_23974:94-714(+)
MCYTCMHAHRTLLVPPILRMCSFINTYIDLSLFFLKVFFMKTEELLSLDRAVARTHLFQILSNVPVTAEHNSNISRWMLRRDIVKRPVPLWSTDCNRDVIEFFNLFSRVKHVGIQLPLTNIGLLLHNFHISTSPSPEVLFMFEFECFICILLRHILWNRRHIDVELESLILHNVALFPHVDDSGLTLNHFHDKPSIRLYIAMAHHP